MDAVCLFSCLGNHSIGLKRAGINTVVYCESDPWRRERIAKISNRPVHDDATTFWWPGGDILIGGPPCQKTSVAAAIHGKRSGDSLWRLQRRQWVYMGRKWLVVEQPTKNKAWEAQVANDISRLGGHCARVEFAACDVGAPYLRRRVYIIASTSLSRLQVAWQAVPSAIEAVKGAADARGDWNPDKLATLPVDARAAGQHDRGSRSNLRQRWIEALGDSNPPHMAEVIGRAIMAAA